MYLLVSHFSSAYGMRSIFSSKNLNHDADGTSEFPVDAAPVIHVHVPTISGCDCPF